MTSLGLGLVIGHRGAPSHLPENTLASFRFACRAGADSVETDVQVSSDGVLVLVHDTELSRTTDVALLPQYAERRTTRVVGDQLLEGWFVDDFTLAELRTLTPESRRIPTLDELLLLLAAESAAAGRRIGLHLEVKNPAYFAAAGLPIAGPLLATLRDHRLDRRGKRVWIQSFDEQFLRLISPATTLPLVQLLEADQPFRCDAVAAYADAIGPDRSLVLAGDTVETGLVAEAHRAGLYVFAWTLRGDVAQARRFLDAGVDGVFSDDPEVALTARGLVPAL
ncbi:glycerophosphodiester phosphodiesterase family protein [Nocardioides sp.]|uniref:glycerophosphodiester phosphodiesterase family protein n=1 Tax=Nocardioides sp. TaxID=35761 RepID=UPI002630C99D|nr:glycerophosphodiester phosphodiesterase family protein [Nocardioides sp.]